MAQVNVTISGKTYRMACDDGEEERLAMLAETLDGAIEKLRRQFGEIGDQRLTVMAAITFADQHAEAERRLAEVEARIGALEAAQGSAKVSRSSADADVARAIAALAKRVEAAAARIGGSDRPEASDE